MIIRLNDSDALSSAVVALRLAPSQEKSLNVVAFNMGAHSDKFAISQITGEVTEAQGTFLRNVEASLESTFEHGTDVIAFSELNLQLQGMVKLPPGYKLVLPDPSKVKSDSHLKQGLIVKDVKEAVTCYKSFASAFFFQARVVRKSIGASSPCFKSTTQRKTCAPTSRRSNLWKWRTTISLEKIVKVGESSGRR